MEETQTQEQGVIKTPDELKYDGYMQLPIKQLREVLNKETKDWMIRESIVKEHELDARYAKALFEKVYYEVGLMKAYKEKDMLVSTMMKEPNNEEKQTIITEN